METKNTATLNHCFHIRDNGLGSYLNAIIASETSNSAKK